MSRRISDEHRAKALETRTRANEHWIGLQREENAKKDREMVALQEESREARLLVLGESTRSGFSQRSTRKGSSSPLTVESGTAASVRDDALEEADEDEGDEDSEAGDELRQADAFAAKQSLALKVRQATLLGESLVAEVRHLARRQQDTSKVVAEMVQEVREFGPLVTRAREESSLASTRAEAVHAQHCDITRTNLLRESRIKALEEIVLSLEEALANGTRGANGATPATATGGNGAGGATAATVSASDQLVQTLLRRATVKAEQATRIAKIALEAAESAVNAEASNSARQCSVESELRALRRDIDETNRLGGAYRAMHTEQVMAEHDAQAAQERFRDEIERKCLALGQRCDEVVQLEARDAARLEAQSLSFAPRPFFCVFGGFVVAKGDARLFFVGVVWVFFF